MSAGDLLDFGLDGEAEKDFDPKASYSSSSSFTAAAFCDESLSGSFLVSSVYRIFAPITEVTLLLLTERGLAVRRSTSNQEVGFETCWVCKMCLPIKMKIKIN